MSDSTLPTAPLHEIMARLRAKPIDNEVTQIKRRMENAGSRRFGLCDLSASMDDYVGSQGLTKLAILKIALKDVVKHDTALEIVGFSHIAFPIAHDQIDNMDVIGSTDMARAFAYLIPHRPRKTIVISDGLPDDPDKTLVEAKKLTGVIDVVYCGPEGHESALEFMRRLTSRGGGSVEKWTLETQCALTGSRIMQRLLA